MKTTFNKYILGVLALVAATLTGCSNEEDLLGAGNSTGEELTSLPVTIGVSVGVDNATRTILSEVNDVMTWKWEKGDQILVYTWKDTDNDVTETNSRCLGYLTAEEPTDEGKKAVFKGYLNFTKDEISNKNTKVRLWYLGKDVDVTKSDSDFKKFIGSGDKAKKFVYDVPLATQEGTEESLAKRDILRSTEATGVDIVIDSDGLGGVAKDVVLSHDLATACFKLTDKDGKPFANKNVVVSGKHFYGNYAVSLAGGTKISNAEGARTITSTTSADGLLYLNLPAMAGVKTDPTIDITFTITDDDKTTEYTGTLKDVPGISAGVYYKAKKDDGTWGPIETILGNPIDEVLNDEVLKELVQFNPLNKWAKGNVVANGEDAYENGGENATGLLFQWGRNMGYEDYIEARGADIKSGNYEYHLYLGVNDDLDDYIHAGTKQYHVDENWYDHSWYVKGFFKLEAKDYSIFKTKLNTFIMNVSLFDNDGDYYIFNNKGGTDWASRAKACGYENSYPVDNWRLPTIDEYKQILPSEGIIASQVSLSESLNNKLELKNIGEIKQYLFRWSSDDNGLIIECLVVPQKFNESHISKVDWNSQYVVKRTFPFTGAIVATTHFHHLEKHPNPDFGDSYDGIAGPAPMFGVDYKECYEYYYCTTVGRWTSAQAILFDFPEEDIAKKCIGAYWTSSNEGLFFSDNKTYSSYTDTNLTTLEFAIHHGLGVRLVNAN